MTHHHPRLYASLVYFASCARHQSFSKAAAELHITNGAMSQQITKLEQRLETTLFHRHSRQLQLSDAGLALFKSLQPALQQIDGALAELKAQIRPLRFRCTPSLLSGWLIERLATFQQQHPELLIEAWADTSLLSLDELQFDLAIDYRRNDATVVADKYPSLQQIKLADELLTPVVSADYARKIAMLFKADEDDLQGLAQRLLQQPQAWRNIQLLHDAEPWYQAGREDEWRDWLGQQPLDADALLKDHQGFYFNRSDMAIAAAKAGVGMALARRSLIEKELADGELIALLPSHIACCSYYLLLSSPLLSEAESAHSMHQHDRRFFATWLQRQFQPADL